MNMMNTMRRGLATTAMSLVCLMAGTMNTLAATDAGTELVSQIDAAAGEETNGTSTEAAQTPSGPASDPELIRSRQTLLRKKRLTRTLPRQKSLHFQMSLHRWRQRTLTKLQ